ncbi:MAG: DNA helicase UvrD [Candidatus Levybacteria bacterium]|nr:DNA helicase UvrD [Candidatus Levybacteria bacterium]MBP9815189.1 DNA helicase UvrD [Candidatus Levybacteria bacterium]
MELVLDLHLHSRFSRAVSPRMNLTNMYLWGRKKGINVFSITDFTHPVWFNEVQSQLIEVSQGMYALKDADALENQLGTLAQKNLLGPYFMLSCEVAAIYTEGGKVHRIHNLIFAPDFNVALKINRALSQRGINLTADGRPILGISSRNLCELLFEISPRIAVIPCHIWTPWFSLYGSKSGYDHIAECFGEYAPRIFAVETGLSSDPSMNWRVKELATRSIVSFSDAHSLEKMGREATVLRKIQKGERIQGEDVTYDNILNSFVRGKERTFEIAYTIEFYPEEGKYHYTGHRNCKVSYTPQNTPKNDICPVCARPLTVGVMKRVEDLAANSEQLFTYSNDKNGVVWVKDPKGVRPPSVSLVPLLEILAEALHTAPNSQKVLTLFDSLIQKFGSEHQILLRTELDSIRSQAGQKISDGIERVRRRDIRIVPGYDGEYGKVSIWKEDADAKVKEEEQLGLKI